MSSVKVSMGAFETLWKVLTVMLNIFFRSSITNNEKCLTLTPAKNIGPFSAYGVKRLMISRLHTDDSKTYNIDNTTREDA